MKFVLVNGRTPNPKSHCALCRDPIGETYVRELSTRLSYCDHQCYLGHRVGPTKGRFQLRSQKRQTCSAS
jgi:hypothetical protein